MKNTKAAIIASSILIAFTMLTSCAGTSDDQLEIPTNMPPICRDIDFVANPDMREMCGVRKAHYKAYKNIPMQRYLIKPSETSIVKTGDRLELRFQNSLPIYLDGPIVNDLKFNQDKRLEKIKNDYDYHEIYSSDKGVRLRIFKMTIPTDVGPRYNFCFHIPEKKGNERTRNKAMGNNIEQISCEKYDQLIQLEKQK